MFRAQFMSPLTARYMARDLLLVLDFAIGGYVSYDVLGTKL